MERHGGSLWARRILVWGTIAPEVPILRTGTNPLTHRLAPALSLLMALAVAGSCGNRPPPAFRDVPGSGPITNPFIPASMIIHPLTRLDEDAAGRLWLYCHIEFKDSWGDNVKSTGMLDLELYRPSGPRSAGMGRQELVWRVDLTDLERNASLYDPATRTYRHPLENPPRWLLEPPLAPDLPLARLRAVLVTGGAREGTRELEDEFTLGR